MRYSFIFYVIPFYGIWHTWCQCNIIMYKSENKNNYLHHPTGTPLTSHFHTLPVSDHSHLHLAIHLHLQYSPPPVTLFLSTNLPSSPRQNPPLHLPVHPSIGTFKAVVWRSRPHHLSWFGRNVQIEPYWHLLSSL